VQGIIPFRVFPTDGPETLSILTSLLILHKKPGIDYFFPVPDGRPVNAVKVLEIAGGIPERLRSRLPDLDQLADGLQEIDPATCHIQDIDHSE
jgi:hypothetical protein